MAAAPASNRHKQTNRQRPHYLIARARKREREGDGQVKDLWKTNQVLFITFYYLALNSADFGCRGDDVFVFIVFLREQVWNDCTYLCVCVCVCVQSGIRGGGGGRPGREKERTRRPCTYFHISRRLVVGSLTTISLYYVLVSYVYVYY